tara:strand:- start:161 stop:754 length:594 start_codon:yes stop_codon:yes gene_type:complete
LSSGLPWKSLLGLSALGYGAYNNKDLIKYKVNEINKGRHVFQNLFAINGEYPPYWQTWNDLQAKVISTRHVQLSKDIFGNLVLRSLQRFGDPNSDDRLGTFYKSKASNILKYNVKKLIPQFGIDYNVNAYIIPLTTGPMKSDTQMYILGLPFEGPDSEQFEFLAKDNITTTSEPNSLHAKIRELLRQWETMFIYASW